MPGKNDPKTYREMSVPFETATKADEGLRKFFDAVEAARKEFHIADVHVVVRINILHEDGEEVVAMSSAHYGNTLYGASMCAWSLGQEQANHDEAIGKLFKQRRA